jgi:hypothetical protein
MEIFAVLVPGIMFILLLVPAIGIPISGVMINGKAKTDSEFISFLSGHTGILLFLLLIVAYIFGQVLFRCDPKHPDRLSILTNLILNKNKKKYSCVQEMGEGRDEYPYHALKSYLQARGFTALARYITWDPCDWNKSEEEKKSSDNSRHRSKHFINRLKLRIKSLDDRIYFEISRNETHIRLMSSLWYMSVTIASLSLVGIFLANEASSIGGELPPLLSFAFAVFMLISINGFFHYQRVREIVFVLEIWHILEWRFYELTKIEPDSYLEPAEPNF